MSAAGCHHQQGTVFVFQIQSLSLGVKGEQAGITRQGNFGQQRQVAVEDVQAIAGRGVQAVVAGVVGQLPRGADNRPAFG